MGHADRRTDGAGTGPSPREPNRIDGDAGWQTDGWRPVRRALSGGGGPLGALMDCLHARMTAQRRRCHDGAGGVSGGRSLLAGSDDDASINHQFPAVPPHRPVPAFSETHTQRERERERERELTRALSIARSRTVLTEQQLPVMTAARAATGSDVRRGGCGVCDDVVCMHDTWLPFSPAA